MEPVGSLERGSPEGDRGLRLTSPSRNSGLFRKREVEDMPNQSTIEDEFSPQEESTRVTSESAAPIPSEVSRAGGQPDQRRIHFEDTREEESEERTGPNPNPEQQSSDTKDATANRPGREFRLRFGLKRTKPQVEDTQATINQDVTEPDSPPTTPAEKGVPKKSRFSFPRLNFNRHVTQKATDDPSEGLTESGNVENVPANEDAVGEAQTEASRLDSETQEKIEQKQRRKNFGFLRRSRTDTVAMLQEHQGGADLTATTPEETADTAEDGGTQPEPDDNNAVSSTWWKPRRLGFEQGKRPVTTTVEHRSSSPHGAPEDASTVHEGVAQESEGKIPERVPTDVASSSGKLRFSERIQRFTERKKSAAPVEDSPQPASIPVGDLAPPGSVSADHSLQPQTGLQLNIEQEEKVEEAVFNQYADGQEVFVSRLFIDRNFTQRRNAPPPSKISSSVFAQRSLATKPGAAGEMYNTCLSKLGRICQGLLGGLCLFFLILLLTADHSQLKSLFGGSGGQGQLLQMLIYLLVIVSVISSFEGLDYQQIIAEKRLNRFCITSVLYPAMLILGLTVMKLDNTLALENGVADDDWREWRTVNIVRSGLGITAWMILCV